VKKSSNRAPKLAKLMPVTLMRAYLGLHCINTSIMATVVTARSNDRSCHFNSFLPGSPTHFCISCIHRAETKMRTTHLLVDCRVWERYPSSPSLPPSPSSEAKEFIRHTTCYKNMIHRAVVNLYGCEIKYIIFSVSTLFVVFDFETDIHKSQTLVYTKLVETSGIVQMRDSCFVILTIAH
jgi:hypothetical protein